MPLYKNPDFLRLPPGLAGIFGDDRQQSFFALPQWYDLMARFGVEAGTEIRVYTDERPNSSAAVLLQNAVGHAAALASEPRQFLQRRARADQRRATPTSTARWARSSREILADRPRWDCIRLLELDPSEESYGALVRALRRAGLLVECTAGAGTWFEATGGMSFKDYLAERPSQLLSTWRRKRRSLAATRTPGRGLLFGTGAGSTPR